MNKKMDTHDQYLYTPFRPFYQAIFESLTEQVKNKLFCHVRKLLAHKFQLGPFPLRIFGCFTFGTNTWDTEHSDTVLLGWRHLGQIL